ncbi:MAG: hypothetical protein V8T87_11090 [Victivallales bacterium]
MDQKIKDILQSADTLLAEFRRVAPNAKIGIGLVTPSARSQDAFGSNYSCGQTRWQYRKNQHRLNEAYLKKFTNHPDKNISIIPTNVDLDYENNFPVVSEPVNTGNASKITHQSNGVHPASAGYRQIGDTFLLLAEIPVEQGKIMAFRSPAELFRPVRSILCAGLYRIFLHIAGGGTAP